MGLILLFGQEVLSEGTFGFGTFGDGTFGGETEVVPSSGSIAARRKGTGLPRICFTADGYPLELSNWSCSSSANLGHDQLRGVASGQRARQVADRIDQGSVIKAFTEHGVTIWEGTTPAPPKVTQEGLVHIAAQGHGYEAVKSGNRASPLNAAPGAWVPANQDPLNFPVTGTDTVITVQPVERLLQTQSTTGTDDAIAFIARGMTLSRLRFVTKSAGFTGLRIIWAADYPDLAGTARVQQVFETLGGTVTWDTGAMSDPGDVVIIQNKPTTGSPGLTQFYDLTVWGDVIYDNIYSEHAAQVLARSLGWDTIGITGQGAVPHFSLDWAGDGAAFLSRIAGLEDFCWGVWEDQGSGPVMTFGPYGQRTWEVSAATGARWDLDALERVRSVVVQFLNLDNSLNEIVLEAPDSFGLPDSVQTSVRGALADQQQSTTPALGAAWRTLERFLTERYRGRVSFARAFDAATRREAPYEVRPGDLIKIVDFAMDGSLTLRVHTVDISPEGVTVGIEAAAFPLGAAIGGGQTAASGGVGFAVPLAASTGGTAVYIPPGSGGGGGGNDTTPWTGGIKPPPRW